MCNSGPIDERKIISIFSAVKWTKLDKTDNNSLTNQPEKGAIPSSISSRVVGCWGVVEEVVFDE